MAALTGSVVLIGCSEAYLMWAHLSRGSDVDHSVGQRRNGVGGWGGGGEKRGQREVWHTECYRGGRCRRERGRAVTSA